MCGSPVVLGQHYLLCPVFAQKSVLNLALRSKVTNLAGGTAFSSQVSFGTCNRHDKSISYTDVFPRRILGAIIQSASYNVRTRVAGRVIVGLSVGIASSVIPIYIASPSAALSGCVILTKL